MSDGWNTSTSANYHIFFVFLHKYRKQKTCEENCLLKHFSTCCQDHQKVHTASVASDFSIATFMHNHPQFNVTFVRLTLEHLNKNFTNNFTDHISGTQQDI